MPNPKPMSNRRSASRARRAKTAPTTALMTVLGVSRGKTFKLKQPALKIVVRKQLKLLEERYSEALAKSQKAGRRASFRVDVDPTGGTTMTPVEAMETDRGILQVEDYRGSSPELQSALATARERGHIKAAQIFEAKDMLNAEAFAELLGTSRMTVNTKRQNGQVLGLDGAKRGYRFPAWQLDVNGKPYAEIPALLQLLGSAWAVYRFLIQPHGALGGLTGRQALERGKGLDAVAAAEGIARGDFT